nr:diguanylate cyclase [Corallococcus sp. EGB]
MRMPGPSGFDLCRIPRLTPEWQALPGLLITAQVGLELRLAAFQAGADAPGQARAEGGAARPRARAPGAGTAVARAHGARRAHRPVAALSLRGGGGLGRLLGARFRREDLRARWGGEEFVVALPGVSAESAKELLSRTAEELAGMSFESDEGESLHVTFSAGLAVAPKDGTTLDELLRVADARLYRAKENGRDRIEAE